MSRPDFISLEDITRWNNLIESELPEELANNETIKEVCYAGQWLGEQLASLYCSEDYMESIIHTAGKLSFGRDPWDIAERLFKAYRNDELEPEAPYSIN